MTSVEKQLLDETVGQLELTGFCLVTADTTVRETVERMRAMKTNCAAEKKPAMTLIRS